MASVRDRLREKGLLAIGASGPLDFSKSAPLGLAYANIRPLLLRPEDLPREELDLTGLAYGALVYTLVSKTAWTEEAYGLWRSLQGDALCGHRAGMPFLLLDNLARGIPHISQHTTQEALKAALDDLGIQGQSSYLAILNNVRRDRGEASYTLSAAPALLVHYDIEELVKYSRAIKVGRYNFFDAISQFHSIVWHPDFSQAVLERCLRSSEVENRMNALLLAGAPITDYSMCQRLPDTQLLTCAQLWTDPIFLANNLEALKGIPTVNFLACLDRALTFEEVPFPWPNRALHNILAIATIAPSLKLSVKAMGVLNSILCDAVPTAIDTRLMARALSVFPPDLRSTLFGKLRAS